MMLIDTWKLNTTRRTAGYPAALRLAKPEDISPRSEDESTAPRIELFENYDNCPLSSQVIPASNDPIPLTKLVLDQHAANFTWFDEMRKIVREEGQALLDEGAHRLTSNSNSRSIGSVPGVAASMESLPGTDQSYAATPPGEVVSPRVAAQRLSVHFDDQVSSSDLPDGARVVSALQKPARWDELFDQNGRATPRLRDVLRGLANYIIGEFEPKNSIVITPGKMRTFYSTFHLEFEVTSFDDIFKSEVEDANECLGDFFDDLRCPYHLVRDDIHSRPTTPALTPDGFARYLEICILAYPEEEFRRMEKIVAQLPLVIKIDAHDGRWQVEHLPRSITTSCFPARHDTKTRKRLLQAIDELKYDLMLSMPLEEISQYAASLSMETDKVSPANNSITQLKNTLTAHDQPTRDDQRQGGRKTFSPGHLQTISDGIVVEGYRSPPQEERRRRSEQRHRSRSSASGSREDAAKGSQSRDDYASFAAIAPYQHTKRPQRPSLSIYGARSQSYSHPPASSNSAPLLSPLSPRSSLASRTVSFAPDRRDDNNPPIKGHNASVSNVINGGTSTNTVTSPVLFTPTTYASVSSLSTANEFGNNAQVAPGDRHQEYHHGDHRVHPKALPPPPSSSASSAAVNNVQRDYRRSCDLHQQHRSSTDSGRWDKREPYRRQGSSERDEEPPFSPARSAVGSMRKLERRPSNRHRCG